MFPIGKKETILLDFIGSLGKLEWLHYQSRIEDEWINDHFEKIDRSKYPPYTSFRFEKRFQKLSPYWKMRFNHIKVKLSGV